MKQQITAWLKEHKSITVPAWLKRNPDILDYVNAQTLHIPDIKNVMERVYIVLNGIPEYCEFGNKRQFNTFELGYRKGCVLGNKCRCVDKHRMQHQKLTLIKKYGVTSVSTIPQVLDKRKKTMKARYGVEHAAQAEHVKVLRKETDKKRTFEEKAAIIDKRRKTTLKKFRVDHHMKLHSQQEKVKLTNQDRYGVEFPLQNADIKNKAKIKFLETCQETYGVHFAVQKHISQETLDILNNKDAFINFVTGKTIYEVLTELNISNMGLYVYSKKYEAQQYFKYPTKSKFEIEVGELLDSLGILYIPNDRKILNGRELDLWIPSLNIAIECSGLYWHSEISGGKSRDYHYTKYKICKDLGITLITIYDDEWNTDNTRVMHRLTHILNQSTTRIYARQCKIQEVNAEEADKFIGTYHLQGNVAASVYIGLYFDNEVVSIMSFGKPRFSKQYEYELIRFCSKVAVVGGASKMWKYFIKKYSPRNVISYSNNKWGHGKVYEKLGFGNSGETLGYEYTNYKQRFNRMRFQKFRLVKEGYDPNMSEWKIMQTRGFDRIWDCGQTTWVWNTCINNTKV